MNKIKRKIAEKSAFTVVSMLFVFLISVIMLLLVMRVVELFAIVKNSRDSLERATLSTAAVNEYRLYKNFRENLISPEPLSEFVTEKEVENTLVSEFGMDKKTDGLYKTKSESEYYYKITDITVEADVENGTDADKYRITTSAVLHIPINLMGYRELSFNINVHCIYASKNNAIE